MKLNIIKGHGSGNDFIIIDNRKSAGLNLDDNRKHDMSIALCNRENNIGADGILFIEDSDRQDAMMRIFNSDGSEAEMCGNGIRLIGRFISEDLHKKPVVIETVTGVIYQIQKQDDFFDGVSAYETIMPAANLSAAALPMVTAEDKFVNKPIPEISDRKFTALAMPNPHIISFVDSVDEKELIKTGEKANSAHSIFPKGVNVSFVKIISDDTIFVATYERGVGITDSCGTAMVASVAASVINSHLKTGKIIKVVNRGGFISVWLNEDLGGKMIGNATYVFTSDFDLDASMAKPKGFTENKILPEILSYEKLAQSVQTLIKQSYTK